MKKILTNISSFLLMFVMVFCISANYSKAAEEGTCGTNLTWKITGDTLTVSGTGAMTSAPLGWGQSTAKDAITKIVVENGVTELAGQAFDYFKNLESVSLPNTLTTIGYNAFAYSGMKSIEIPASVTKIDNSAFEGSSIESIVIPDSVTDLGGGIFRNCTSLKEVTLPNSDIECSYSDFYGCNILEKITVRGGILTNRALANMPSLTTLTIGAGVTRMENLAVSGNKNLKTIIIEEGKLETIPMLAFSDNTALKEIEIPASVKKIDSDAFSGCTSLSKVTFHEGLEQIGSYSFVDCPALHEVTIPKSVTTIFQWAFHGAYKTTVSGGTEEKDYYVYEAYTTDFIMKGYINTAAEEYASREYYNITFQALGGDISGCTVTADPASYTYDGKAKTPAVKVTSAYANVEIPGCVIAYSNNINIGTATVTAKGTGKFTGTATGTFTISDKDASNNGGNGITKDEGETLLLKLESYGILEMPFVEELRAANEREKAVEYATYCYYAMQEYGYSVDDFTIDDLVAAIMGDYISSEPSTEKPSDEEPSTEDPSDNEPTTEAPTTEAPSKDEPTTETPTTEPTEITKPSKTTITEVVSVAKGIKVTWKKVENADSYIIYRDGKKVKTTDKLTWTDTKAKKNGKVYKYKVVAVNEAGKSKASKVVKAAYVAPVKITKAINIKGKKATIQWKKNAKATGYEVKYVLGKTEKTASIKKAETVKTTLKSLKKGKTYKVYVRTYKTIKGKKYYSAWSAVKKVKVTK